MARTVIRPTSLRDAPSTDANPILPLAPGDHLEDLGEQKDSFSKVEHPLETGWVKTNLLTDFVPSLDPIKPEKLAEVAFAAGQSYEISPAYLLALAGVASGLKNGVIKGGGGVPDSFGIFRFTLQEWGDCVKEFAQSDVRADQIGDPASQCLLVAAMTKRCINALNGPDGIETQTVAQVCFSHLLGWNGADVLIQLLKGSRDESLSVEEGLMAVYKDRGKVAAILNRRAQFLLNNEQPVSLKQALDSIAKSIDVATPTANSLVKDYVQKFPDDIPAQREAETESIAAVSTPLPKTPFGSTIHQELEDMFKAAKIKPGKKPAVDDIANRILANRSRYTVIESETGVPWWFIGILHNRESGGRFATYLGNGQRLDRRTTIVPKGRGPFPSFEAGAIDALRYDGVANIKSWTIGLALYRMEKFNGFGYRSVKPPIPSPYVWSGTDQYVKGKFIADHVYDKNKVDEQIGGAALMKLLLT